jgi:hypothetical protein
MMSIPITYRTRRVSTVALVACHCSVTVDLGPLDLHIRLSIYHSPVRENRFAPGSLLRIPIKHSLDYIAPVVHPAGI